MPGAVPVVSAGDLVEELADRRQVAVLLLANVMCAEYSKTTSSEPASRRAMSCEAATAQVRSGAGYECRPSLDAAQRG